MSPSEDGSDESEGEGDEGDEDEAFERGGEVDEEEDSS